MRVLVTFAGGTGHFLPTLPYARQLRARGPQVRYGCQQAMLAVVEAAGFPAVDTGGATLLPPDERRPLSPVDRAHEQRVVADFFVARVGTDRAARISALIADWRPDLVLRDEMDVGAGVAAEAAGVPSADFVVVAARRVCRPRPGPAAAGAVACPARSGERPGTPTAARRPHPRSRAARAARPCRPAA